MYTLRLFGYEPFYTPPTAQDFLIVVLMFIGVLLFFRLIQWLTSDVSKVNYLDNSKEHELVSPFLITECYRGDVFSEKKNSVGIRVVAVLLLVLVILTPLPTLLGLL